MTTPAFTLTIVADSVEQLHQNMVDMLPAGGVLSPIDTMPFQELLLKVDTRCEAEGYEMEVYKRGERPEPELPLAERKKAEARAKLRGDLVNSLAEATHATSAVKKELDAEVVIETATVDPAPKKIKTRPGETEVAPDPVDAPGEETDVPLSPKSKKAKGNGKGTAKETPEALKDRIILRLQELYSEGRKADVNKLLATHGNGVKTFSAIPADQFAVIAEAVEALA